MYRIIQGVIYYGVYILHRCIYIIILYIRALIETRSFPFSLLLWSNKPNPEGVYVCSTRPHRCVFPSLRFYNNRPEGADLSMFHNPHEI